MTEYENKEVLTLAGLLCFGKYPQKFFTGLTIHIIVYPSKEITSKIGMGPPLFRDYRSSFNVTCFNNTLFNKQNIHETNKIKKIRSKGDEILEFLSFEGESGVEEISRSLKINKRTTRFWIKRLIDEAKIVSNSQLSKSPKIKYKIKN